MLPLPLHSLFIFSLKSYLPPVPDSLHEHTPLQLSVSLSPDNDTPQRQGKSRPRCVYNSSTAAQISLPRCAICIRARCSNLATWPSSTVLTAREHQGTADRLQSAAPTPLTCTELPTQPRIAKNKINIPTHPLPSARGRNRSPSPASDAT